MRINKALLSALSFILLAAPLQAQTVLAPNPDAAVLRASLAPVMAPAGRPMPADAAVLDALLRANENAALVQRLKQASTAHELLLDTNWEQRALYQGAGFVVSYSLMIDLWRLAAQPDQNSAQLKETAALFFLYSLDLVVADGPKCQDDTAPGHRMDQLIFENTGILRYLKALPVTQRMQVGTVSLRIEKATAGLRQNDVVLCSNGMAEAQAALQNGSVPRPVATPLGMVGKAYAVTPPSDYRPGFLAPDQWRSKQLQVRAGLPDLLTKILAAPQPTQ